MRRRTSAAFDATGHNAHEDYAKQDERRLTSWPTKALAHVTSQAHPRELDRSARVATIV